MSVNKNGYVAVRICDFAIRVIEPTIPPEQLEENCQQSDYDSDVFRICKTAREAIDALLEWENKRTFKLGDEVYFLEPDKNNGVFKGRITAILNVESSVKADNVNFAANTKSYGVSYTKVFTANKLFSTPEAAFFVLENKPHIYKG